MALIAYYGFRIISKKAGGSISRILSGIAAEVFMILGYFTFERVVFLLFERGFFHNFRGRPY